VPLGTKYKIMANTYTQIQVQTVFAVQNKQSLIKSEWEKELYKSVAGIIQNHNHKLIQINGTPNHIHIIFGMRPKQSLSDLMKQVRQDSSRWINNRGFINRKFSWQAGYGAFSYSKDQLSNVINYIKNQKEHHKIKTFTDEYLELFHKFNIDYDIF
jgi:REP element-mobilizing transposase RayT